MELASYSSTGLLASGSACLVYEATHVRSGRHVAIKTPRPELLKTSPTFAQLEDEARTLSRLAHPNVVLLIDAQDDAEGRPCLVFEHVKGETLRALRNRKTRLRVDVACAIGLQLLRALEHVHARGFVHRDVQPDNVLVSSEGVKLIDFGAATPLNAKAPSRTHQSVYGTPNYMAPEQVLGEASSPASDLFSVGVVLYELICGRRPWDGNQGVRADACPPLRSRAPEVPHAIDAFILRLLRKRAEERFDSATLALDALSLLFRDMNTGTETDLLGTLGGNKKKAPEPGVVGPRSRSMDVLPFAAIGAAFLFLSLALRAITGDRTQPMNTAPLPLVPDDPAYLRVLANPWAEVWIDGQRVETTPFARPVPIPAGLHFVTLKHPDAPPMERRIDPKKGETVTLDVSFDVASDGGVDLFIDAASDAEIVFEGPRAKEPR